MSDRIVFFLGNGAAIAEMDNKIYTSELLAKAIQEFDHDQQIKNIKKFVKQIFAIESFNDISRIPTFEEVLTLIDVCLQKKEEFSGDWRLDNLTKLRKNMTYLLYKILDNRLETSKDIHENFVKKLFGNRGDCNKYSFLTLNYDILLDNPLIDLRNKPLELYLDFGIHLRNFDLTAEEKKDPETARKYKWDKPKDNKSVLLLKLHGSLSWLHCPTCNDIITTPKEKGVKYIYDPQVRNDNILKQCAVCGSLRKPVIIPPTWQKEYVNPNLVRMWLTAERLLQKTNKVFFIGYSLPESDVNVRYLLKKSLYRKNAPVEIYIINTADLDSDERKRYKRLFGSTIKCSQFTAFEYFVEKLDDFIKR
ncbi:MAG: SIR2 family protein [bacterium]